MCVRRATWVVSFCCELLEVSSCEQQNCRFADDTHGEYSTRTHRIVCRRVLLLLFCDKNMVVTRTVSQYVPCDNNSTPPQIEYVGVMKGVRSRGNRAKK